MNKNVEYLTPFKTMVMTVGNLPTSYVESMSYYEGLTYLVKYLTTEIIPVVDNNASLVKELEDYVTHYFDSLDIQDEIDTKLDKMAADGELSQILLDYLELNGLIVFDTIAAMKLADNLIDGSYLRTLSKTSLATGDGAFYKVRLLDVSDVIDDDLLVGLTNYPELVAEKITDYVYNTLDSKIDSVTGDLSDLDTTVKTDLVSAINEVKTTEDTKIGDLSSLNTTVKTNTVGAINEVNTKASNVLSTFNISNFHSAVRQTTDSDTAQITLGRFYPTLESFTANATNISNVFCSINCATNDDGSLGKIYGIWYCTTNYTLNAANGYPCLRFRCSDFNVAVPKTGYNINAAGVNHGQDRINPADIYIGSDGYIYLYGRVNGSATSDPWQCVYIPCLLFFTDFGDTPIDETVEEPAA